MKRKNSLYDMATKSGAGEEERGQVANAEDMARKALRLISAGNYDRALTCLELAGDFARQAHLTAIGRE